MALPQGDVAVSPHGDSRGDSASPWPGWDRAPPGPARPVPVAGAEGIKAPIQGVISTPPAPPP